MTYALRRFSVGNGGWVCAELEGSVTLYARFADDDGRLEVVELFLEGRTIDATLLRRIPMGLLERIANSEKWSTLIRSRFRLPAPQPSIALSYYGTTAGHQTNPETLELEPVISPWVWAMLWSQVDAQVAPPAVHSRQRRTGRQSRPIAKEPEDATLDVPAGRPYPDDFYRQVAELYAALVAAGRQPAPVIAEANGVPATTVHRWVRVARERGFLGPAAGRGRAGERQGHDGQR